MRRTRLWFLVWVLFALIPGARGDWRIEGETGVVYQSNLSNSDREADVKDDWAWTADARVANGLQLGRDWRVTVAVDGRAFVWGEFCGFDEVGAGFSADLRYRFGLGAQAPWVSVGGRIGYDQFRENFRSGCDGSVRVRGGMPISQRLALEAGYTFENLAAADAFFDRQAHRLELRLIFDLTSSCQIGIGYFYRNGNVISYAIPPRPDIFSFAPVRPGITTFGTNPTYNAYNFRGTTNAISAFAAYTLGKYWALKVDYEYSETSRHSLHYQNHLVAAKIAFAY